jgi:two-component system cell cycle sensor histidine kinase/response regulator CckA
MVVSPHILIVEDSPTQAEALRALLEEHRYVVTVTRTGEEALDRVVSSGCDLVLTDIMMPGMSGYDLCRALKADERTRRIPVVLLTTLGDPMDIVRGLECGADNYVTKPYDPAYLLTRVRQVLDRNEFRRNARATVDIKVSFLGKTLSINSDREQILDLFISSVEEVVRTNRALQESQRELADAQRMLEKYADQMAWRARVSTERYSTLMESASDAIVVLDTRGCVIEVNSRGVKLFGRPMNELQGRVLAEFMHPDHHARVAGAIAELGRTPNAHLAEIQIRRAPDRVAYCDIALSRAPGVEGDLALAIIHDITARRHADEALRRSEERYRLVAKASNEVIWDWDIASGRASLSGALAAEFGLATDVDSVPFESWAERVHPDDVQRVNESLFAIVDGNGDGRTEEYRLRRADGTYAVVISRGHVIRDADGKAVRMIGSLADVTESRELEEQLRQSQKMEAIGRLAGGVAHDFNNLLTAIKGYAQVLLMDIPPSNPLHSDLEEIDKAASRAAALTGQLLAFSRKQVLQPRVISLNRVITDMEKMLRRLISENIRLTVAADPALDRVKVDPSRMEQVVMNLVVNAGDAMPNGGALTIATRNKTVAAPLAHRYGLIKAGNYAVLSVTDTGTGMDERVLEHLFEPFFTTKAPGHGTGLGLATVFGIVQASGGHVLVSSTPGRGTTFEMFLPRVDTEHETPTAQATFTALPRGTETILLVEDEDAVRAIARRILEKSGYAVIEAPHGVAALEACRERCGSIDLLVTDVVMPEMGGPELAERLAEICPNVRVLFMSGYADRNLIHRGGLAGPVALVDKPFTPERLARMVRKVLDDVVTA